MDEKKAIQKDKLRAAPLIKLNVGDVIEQTNARGERTSRPRPFVGSIRFPGTTTEPAKWVRLKLPQCTSEGHLRALYQLHASTWATPPPCAVISVPPAGVADGSIPDQLRLALARGLVAAAKRTNAWVITGGAAEGVAGVIGGALKGAGVPTVGVAAWERTAETALLEENSNGQVHLYGSGDNVAYAAKRGSIAGAGVVPLDPHHTHFLLVDGKPVAAVDGKPVAAADAAGVATTPPELVLRSAFERLICDEDVSGDGIETPKVVLVAGGDATTLRWVKDALDPHSTVSGKSRPVLVLADSGGAAADIWRYCGDEKASAAGELPTISGGRTADYVAEAHVLLPEIARLGAMCGNNTTPQLSFYRLSDDMEAEDNLALGRAIQSALLNDCASRKDEILLAVSWGEPHILRELLERNAASSDLKQLRKDKGVALTEALLRRDAGIARCLVEFSAEAKHVDIDRLFCPSLNKYDVEPLWPTEDDDVVGGGEAGGLSTAERGGGAVASAVRARPNRAALDGDAAALDGDVGAPRLVKGGGGAAARKPRSRLGRKSRRVADGDDADAPALWELILERWADGYTHYLRVRTHLARAAGEARPDPNWFDLVLWATLCGEVDLVKLLWERTEEPLRAALTASQVCAKLGYVCETMHRAELADAREAYEQLALDLLDAVKEEKEALPLLALVRCEEEPVAGGGRLPLWDESPIDSACEEDGRSSFPCARLVAHPHAQFLIEEFFAGHFPGSRAHINPGVGPLRILLQSLLFFIPGTIVEVKKVTELMPNQPTVDVDDAVAALRKSGRRPSRDAGPQIDGSLVGLVSSTSSTLSPSGRRRSKCEMDPDLPDVSVIESFGAGVDDGEDALQDIGRDIKSGRLLYFFFVPKVKFVMYFAAHLAFVAYTTYLLLGGGWGEPAGVEWFSQSSLPGYAAWMRREGQIPAHISPHEIVFFVWALTRFFGEFGDMKKSLRLYLRDVWNACDLLISVLTLVLFGLRLPCALLRDELSGECRLPWLAPHDEDVLRVMARNFYAIILIFLYLRTIQYLRYWEKAGVMSIVLLRMLPDVKIFFSLVMIISFGFGAAFAVLLPGRMDKPFSYAFSSSPLWFPFWGLYGEFDRHDFEEYVEDEMPTRLISLVLMWLYMLITTIVLVNLLIAQMSETYAKEMEKATQSWLFERAQLVLEFKDAKASPLPPPLAPVYDIAVFLRNCIRRRPAEPGFRVVTRAPQQRRLTKAEALFRRDALERNHARDAETVDVKVDTLGEGMDDLMRANYSRFESLTGRVERLEEKLSKKLDAIEKALKSGKRGGGGGHTPGDLPKLEKLGALPPPPPFAHGPSYMLVAQQKPGDSPLKKEM